jgi:hypothetical protein
MDLSYRIVSGQTYRAVSPPKTVIVSYRIVHYRREIHLHQHACGDLSCYRKLSPPSPNRIVSYRIVSPWRGYRLLAYRELSQIALIGKYRIVTYRALIVSYRIGRSRAMAHACAVQTALQAPPTRPRMTIKHTLGTQKHQHCCVSISNAFFTSTVDPKNCKSAAAKGTDPPPHLRTVRWHCANSYRV